MIGGVSIWQAAVQTLFEDAKDPGTPVVVAAPAKESACDLLADAQSQLDCRHVAGELNASAVSARQDLPLADEAVDNTSYASNGRGFRSVRRHHRIIHSLSETERLAGGAAARRLWPRDRCGGPW